MTVAEKSQNIGLIIRSGFGSSKGRIMRTFSTSLLGLMLAAGSVAVLRADSIFDFENVPLGTSTNFSGTSADGLYSASFTTGVPGSFFVDVNPDGIGSGHRLIQTDATAIQNPQIIPLTISISSGQFSSVTFPFALLAPVGDNATLTLRAFFNGTLLGPTVTVPTTTPQNTGFYSTGLLTFDPGPGNDFNSFELTSSVPGLGIDDVSLTPSVSAVPEPATTALVLFGMAGVLGYVRRRQRGTCLLN